MTPIQDLLHRIQWDPEFGKGEFVIGYHDRLDDRIVRVPFQRVHLARGQHFSFDVIEDRRLAAHGASPSRARGVAQRRVDLAAREARMSPEGQEQGASCAPVVLFLCG